MASPWGRPSGSSGAAEPPRARPSQQRVVQLDGLVVLKIIQHCSLHFPDIVAGSLLGLDVDDAVEVTHSFPYPQDSEATDGDGESYELEMMKALREVNVDNNSVGWYQCTYLGSYCTKDTITHQLEYQQALPNSVLIIYDSVKTSLGQLSIKALRLTDAFIAAYRSKRVSMDAIASLSASQIFEELPLRIRNQPLVTAGLYDLAARRAIVTRPVGAAAVAGATTAVAAAGTAAAAAASATAAMPGGDAAAAGFGSAAGAGAGGAGAAADVDFARLDLNAGPFLEKHLELLKDVTDQLLRAQMDAAAHTRRVDYQRRQRDEWLARRREENELRRRNGEAALPEEDASLPFFRPVEPPRSGKDQLDVLLMSANISNYCGQVSKFAGASFGKLFLASSLHK